MTTLYDHKWVSKQGELDVESYNFSLWCEKTEHLTNEDWARGIKRCEYDLTYAAKIGDDSVWPPCYAEFIGFCEEIKKPKYFYGSALLPEPEEEEQKRKERGLKGLEGFRSIVFDEEG